MKANIEHISSVLKQARLAKNWSQRDLSAETKIPQAHISRIENGNVNLKLASLVELARTLNLELKLIPKSLVTSVNAIIWQKEEADNIANKPQRPAYNLDDEE